jgi:hypothetical protein
MSKLLLLLLLGAVQVTQASTLHLKAPMIFSNSSSGEWENLENQMIATKADTIILDWQGIGGYVSIGAPFVAAMKQAQRQGKKIIIRMTGTSASMHSLVVCQANQVQGDYIMMFHSVGNKNYRYPEGRKTVGYFFDACVKKGILTSHEVDVMWAGNVVYTNPSHSYVNIIPDKRPAG